jgi:hypothetical protein
MGIEIGTTLNVTFTAEELAKLDCLLQLAYFQYPETDTHYFHHRERIASVYHALSKAGYR